MSTRRCALAIELTNKWLWFSLEDKSVGDIQPINEVISLSGGGEPAPESLDFSHAYGVFLTEPVIIDTVTKVRRAVQLNALDRALKGLPSTATLQGLIYDTGEPLSLCRGFIVVPSKGDQECETEESLKSVLREVASKHTDEVFQVLSITKAGQALSVAHGWSGEVDEASAGPVTYAPHQPPACHPVFSHPLCHSVFYDAATALEVLHQVNHLRGVNELIEIAAKHLSSEELEHNPSQEVQLPTMPQNKPFIVVEGLDGAGKSTLVGGLCKATSGQFLSSPPTCLVPLRSTFDSYPRLVRRAYYTIGNHIAAKIIEQTRKEHTVIMDRFWHSTSAYTIATECITGDESLLPPVGHTIYQWPDTLLRPDMVILVLVDEQVRKERIDGRLEAKTQEELNIEKDELFGKRILTAYRRMANPGVVEVDASGTRKAVLRDVMDTLVSHGVLRPGTDAI